MYSKILDRVYLKTILIMFITPTIYFQKEWIQSDIYKKMQAHILEADLLVQSALDSLKSGMEGSFDSPSSVQKLAVK